MTLQHRGTERSRLKRLALPASAAAVLAVAAVVVVPSAAFAAAPAGCSSGYACIYKDASYISTDASGQHAWDIQTNSTSGIPILDTHHYGESGGHNAGTGANSASSSYNNMSTSNAYYFKNQQGTGAYFYQTPGHGDGDFSNGTPVGSDNSGNFNDQLDSMYKGNPNA